MMVSSTSYTSSTPAPHVVQIPYWITVLVRVTRWMRTFLVRQAFDCPILRMMKDIIYQPIVTPSSCELRGGLASSGDYWQLSQHSEGVVPYIQVHNESCCGQ